KRAPPPRRHGDVPGQSARKKPGLRLEPRPRRECRDEVEVRVGLRSPHSLYLRSETSLNPVPSTSGDLLSFPIFFEGIRLGLNHRGIHLDRRTAPDFEASFENEDPRRA